MMSDQIRKAYLPGWGFSGEIWREMRVLAPQASTNMFIDLPLFNDVDDEKSLLDALRCQLQSVGEIHAWSLSCLWLLKLLPDLPGSVAIHLYNPAVDFTFGSEVERVTFIQCFIEDPKRLSRRFLSLVTAPYAERDKIARIKPYCQLGDASRKQSWLNYLNWMLMQRPDFTILAAFSHSINIGQHDRVVHIEPQRFNGLNVRVFPDQGHLPW